MRWAPLILLVACSSDLRAAARLEGTWLSRDGTTLRGLVVEDRDGSGWPKQTYRFYLYEEGRAPVEVQSGLLSVLEDEVLFDVRDDVDATNIGQRFASAFLRVDRRTIELQGRTYEQVDVLPGARTEPLAFGEFDHVALFGAPGSLTVLDDGSAWAVAGVPSRAYRYEAGVLEETIGPQTLGMTALGEDLVYVDGGHLVRAAVVEEPPARAGGRRGLVFEPVWTTEITCWSGVALVEAVVGHCASNGLGLPTDEALVWFHPDDGSILRAEPAGYSHLYSLGEDLLVQQQAPSPTPAVHGERSTDGWLLQRYRADGSLVFQHWSPARRAFVSVDALDEQDIVYSSVAHSIGYDGVDPDGSTPHPWLGRLGVEGVVWERALPAPHAWFGQVAAREGGFVLLSAGQGDDLGLGPIGREGPDSALGLIAMDGCGAPYQQVVVEGADGNGANAYPSGLAWGPGGDLYVASGLDGTFDFGVEPSTLWGDNGFIGTTGAPEPARGCELPGPHVARAPVIRVDLQGEGEVRIGEVLCESSCEVSIERYQEVVVEANEADGFLFTGVSGACEELPCVLHGDQTEQTLQVTFEPSQALLLPSSDEPRKLAAGQSVVFAAATISPSVVAELDGIVLADGPAGETGYLAVLDSGGVLGNVALPSSDPVVYDLEAVPGTDEALALTQTGTVHRFDASGLIGSSSAPAGFSWRHVAIDGTGQIAVLGEVGNEVRLAAVDGTWSVSVGTTASVNQTLALVGRSAGGFSAIGYGGSGASLPDGTVLSGSLGDLLHLRVDGSGSVLHGGVLPGIGPLVPGFPAWEEGGQLAVVKRVSWSSSPPVGDVFVDRIDDAGVFQSTTGFPYLNDLRPFAGGYVGFGVIGSVYDPFGGPDLPFGGNTDLHIAWFDSAGVHQQSAAIGGPGYDDLSPYAVLPDGDVYVSSGIGGGAGSATHAIGIFSAP